MFCVVGWVCLLKKVIPWKKRKKKKIQYYFILLPKLFDQAQTIKFNSLVCHASYLDSFGDWRPSVGSSPDTPPITVICLTLLFFFLLFFWGEAAQNVPDSSSLLPAQVLESAIIPRGPDSFLNLRPRLSACPFWVFSGCVTAHKEVSLWLHRWGLETSAGKLSSREQLALQVLFLTKKLRREGEEKKKKTCKGFHYKLAKTNQYTCSIANQPNTVTTELQKDP